MRVPLLKGSRPCMGSVLDITLVGIDARRGRDVLDAAFDEAARLERRLSIFDPDSDVSRLNREGRHGPVQVSPDVLWLIEEAVRLSKISGGVVDPTVAPLTRIWRNRDDRNGGLKGPPLAAELSRARSKSGASHLVVDRRASTVAFRLPGIELEFGALGKGYAVDRVVHLLGRYGVSSAFVHFGSTTYALGRPPGKGAWRVGIRHPRDPHRLIEVVKLSDRAIATSADDQQANVIGGTPYGHILDPRTGLPATGSLSASVVAPKALDADAFSTAAFVLGSEKGADLLTRTGLHGMITSPGNGQPLSMVETPGWKGLVVGQRVRGLVTRRRVLGGLLATLAAVLIRPSLGFAVVYLTRDEALRVLMPDAEAFTEETMVLTDSQRERVETLMGGRVHDRNVTMWVAVREGLVVGYATVLDVVGKEQPITFMVAVAPEGVVRGVQVLTYRESQGSEIRSKRFLDQFAGKTLAAPLKLGRDVHGISGASLSSRSTTYAVKKTLALVSVVYGTGATPS